MAYYGRHRVHVMFWPWQYGQFVTTADLVMCTVSKSASSGSTARFTLFPRGIPYRRMSDGRILRDENTGYMDALGPNDWVFIWVDPGDGENTEPLFMGFIDRVSVSKDVGDNGVNYAIDVSCTGFEKAINNTIAITNPWVSSNINIPNLIALGTSGYRIDSEGLTGAPGVDLSTGLTPNVIAWLMRTFLNVERLGVGEDYSQQAAALDELVRSLTGVAEDDVSSSLQAIMGQFMLPRVGIPLWHFLRLRFQDVQERAYLDPAMFLNGASTPLSQFIDTFSNQLLNELIYDVRRVSSPGISDIQYELVQEVTGGYSEDSLREFMDGVTGVDSGLSGLFEDLAPHVIFRRRPLFADELIWLDGPRVAEEDFASMDLGPSDNDLHNLTMIDTPSVHANSPARIVSGFPGFQEYAPQSLYSIARHGLRIYNDTTMAWPATAAAPHPSPDLIREWEIRLTRAGLDNARNWNGHVSFHKYVRSLFLGGKLEIQHRAHPGVTTRSDRRVYYVDSLDYNYSAASGNFETGAALVRGQVI